MAEIVVEQSGEVIIRVPLKGATMTIGRDPQCDLHLDNKALSRKHAQLERRGAAIWLRDLGSQNGTRLNGQVLAAAQALRGGDVIELGKYKIRLEGLEEAPADTPVLTLTGPDGKSHAFGMVEAEVVIGRAPSCDISVNDKNISRRHVRIARQGDGFLAEDLGSQNGTLVGGRKILGPTPFRVAEPVQMGQYVIVATFMASTAAAGAPKSSRTIVFDRSELHKAAYVGGNHDDNASDDPGSISAGGEEHGGESDSDEDQTKGIDEVPASPPRPVPRPPLPMPPPSGRVPLPPTGRLPSPPQPPQPLSPSAGSAAPTPTSIPTPPRVPATPTKKPLTAPTWATVSHPDHGDRPVLLQEVITIINEDGSDGDAIDGRLFATMAAMVLVRTATGVAVTVAGDRRAVLLNGNPVLVADANDGDVLELGVLRAVFHRAG